MKKLLFSFLCISYLNTYAQFKNDTIIINSIDSAVLTLSPADLYHLDSTISIYDNYNHYYKTLFYFMYDYYIMQRMKNTPENYKSFCLFFRHFLAENPYYRTQVVKIYKP